MFHINVYFSSQKPMHRQMCASLDQIYPLARSIVISFLYSYCLLNYKYTRYISFIALTFGTLWQISHCTTQRCFLLFKIAPAQNWSCLEVVSSVIVPMMITCWPRIEGLVLIIMVVGQTNEALLANRASFVEQWVQSERAPMKIGYQEYYRIMLSIQNLVLSLTPV